MSSSLLALLAIIFADSLNVLVAIIAWVRNPRAGFGPSFFVVSLAGTFWATTNYYSYTTNNLQLTTTTTHLTLAGGLWLLMSICYFALRFPSGREPTKRLRLAALVLAFAGGVFATSRLVVTSVSIKDSTVVITPGIAYVVYIVILLAVSLLSLFLLYRQYVHASLVAKNQIRYVSFGIGVAGLLGIILNGILPIFYPAIGGAKVNFVLAILFILFVGYGLVRNRYIDIHTIGAKLTTYLGCFGLLVVVIGASKHLLDSSLHQTSATQNGIIIIAAALTLLVQPFKSRLEIRVNQLVRRHWYDPENCFRRVAEILASEQRLDTLLQTSLDFLGKELGVTSGAFAVITANKATLAQQFNVSGQPPIELSLKQLTSLRSDNLVLLADDLPKGDPRRAIMEDHQVRMAAQLISAGTLVGFLLMGTKQSGDIFTRQDVRVLSILSNQLAVAIVRSEAYEEINQFNSTLAKRVDEATQELREAHEKLQADDRMKSEFLILTSHNLRTPLSIINGYTEMLSATSLADEQRKYLDTIAASMNRLRRLVDDLLTITTLESGKQSDHKPVKAADVLLPMVDELKKMLQGSVVELVSAVDVPAEATIDGSLVRLSGAVWNVLDNALKFTKDGSINFNASVNHNQLTIHVSDTGIGIRPEELPNIFNKFHRATSVMQYDYDGEGIGLYLSKLIIQEHDGRIEVQSDFGKGTGVTITLPLVHA